jgi:SOS-response transcriptional repressor LexA
MTTTERLKQFIDYKGLSNRKFSEAAGLSNGFIGKVKEIGSSKLSSIVDSFPELNLEWLVTGRGEMLKKEVLMGLPSDYQMVPLVDTEVIGGYDSVAFKISEENIIGYYPVGSYGLAKVDFSVRIHGESMWPRYCGGDTVDCKIIEKGDYIQWNRIYVISTHNQGLLLKRVKKGTTSSEILLVSDNPSFDSFEIPMDEVYGMALVLGGKKIEW